MSASNSSTSLGMENLRLAKSRARILLKAADGLTDDQIATALAVGVATVERTRTRFVEQGVGALHERPRPGAPPKLTGKHQAHMVAVACSEAPEGHTHWTMRLLAGKVVELGFTESCSRASIRRLLKKTSSSRGRSASGAFQQ
jgi:transposase